MSNLLILHMRDQEIKALMEGAEGSDEGIKKSQLISWYLEQIAEEIETEEECIERKSLVEKVIERLVTHDQVLIPLRTVDHLKEKGDAEETEEDDPVLVVHPNYIIE